MAKSQRQRRAQGTQRAASRASGVASVTATHGAANSTVAKSPAGGSRLAEIRERTPQRPQQQRRRYVTQPWWRRNLGALSAVAAVVVVIIGFIIYANVLNKKATVDIGSPAPKTVLAALSGVSEQTATAVGSGGARIGLEGTPPQTPMLTKNGLPEIVYVGAEYCPYCAAERWGMIIALNRFGSFKGLTLMKSTSQDVFPNTNTFTFKGATYTSKYLVFNATETEDRNQKPLDKPSAEAIAAFSTYDIPPYTNQQGGIPFVSYANQYVTTEGPFQPTMLQNLTWEQIATQLSDPNSSAAKAIIGTANVETAAICKVTNNQASVCAAPYIQTIEKTLPAR